MWKEVVVKDVNDSAIKPSDAVIVIRKGNDE